MTDPKTDAEQLRGIAEAAQQAAAVLAAKHRGDRDGVATLMGGFASDRAMAGGFLLLAELSLGMYREQTQLGMGDCLQDLCLHLGAAAEAAGR